MAQTVKTVVMRRIGEVAIMDKPIPEPGLSDAIVKTTPALVCTSDTHTVAGAGTVVATEQTEEITMATRGYELLSDEGLEIVYSVTLQALVRLVPRESSLSQTATIPRRSMPVP
jgi:hypothetical protein